MSLGQEREAARAASSGADGTGNVARALTLLIQSASVLSCLIILAAFGIILYAVTMRYFVGTPINWSDELNGYLIVAMVMFGIGSTLLRGGHISIDLLTARAGPRLSAWVEVLADVAVLLFALMFGWSAWHTVAFSRDFGTYSTGYLETPMWLVQTPMVAGAAFLALAALVRMLRVLRGEAR